ncbi:MAG TPA: cyclic nucleotide-binding domain-containing protein, partial [Blastocatellia bacterium]|nr:cyclic nucleotide-binding domain-containing protein [Blastocatellia bacterium]
MIQETPDADLFKQQLRDSLLRETRSSHAITVSKNTCVYNIGDTDDTVYFIDSGQIKLLMLSPQGKECMLAIYTTGDIFGELCLSGLPTRLDRAIAMEDSRIKKIMRDSFLKRLGDDSLFKGFVQYLAVR